MTTFKAGDLAVSTTPMYTDGVSPGQDDNWVYQGSIDYFVPAGEQIFVIEAQMKWAGGKHQFVHDPNPDLPVEATRYMIVLWKGVLIWHYSTNLHKLDD